jgi:hypothetical protein
MQKIAIGETNGKPVRIDLDILLTSRLLIQANSGGGKSFTIRRLAEQSFGKIQEIIIDPEGEFSTLRERHGFVLVGPGGETPADVRSAGLVALKLLELNASAVCDIYELKSAQRHLWVKAFLEAMINAPKKLWHPCLVIVDEAHVFCPERGAGESEATEAMTDLCTRGRKRGFCAVFATQRLGKLSKNASAELQNRLVGPTFEDIDRKRAGELFGDPSPEFKKLIQLLEPGNFFAIGRAIARERIQFQVGPVETSHPQPGTAKHAAGPPPAPASVSKLLPQLADLPKEAEQRAATEQELRGRIRALEIELTRHSAKTVNFDQVRDEAIYARVKEAIAPYERYLSTSRALLAGALAGLEETGKNIRTVADRIRQAAELKVDPPIAALKTGTDPRPIRNNPITAGPRMVSERPSAPRMGEPSSNGLSRPQKQILRGLAELAALNRTMVSRTWAAFVAGVSPSSSGFEKNIGRLNVLGLVRYPAPGKLELTREGAELVEPIERPMNSVDLLDRVCRLLTGPQSELLRILVDRYPNRITRDELAAAANVSPESSGFEKNVGALSARDLATYPEPGQVRAAEWLFL